MYIHQTLTIVDLKKLSSKFLSKKIYRLVGATTSVNQNYYPEILGQMYIINTGFAFKAAWTVVKAFLDEKTRKKMISCGKDYLKKLIKEVI